jgi:hypothetical protein
VLDSGQQSPRHFFSFGFTRGHRERVVSTEFKINGSFINQKNNNGKHKHTTIVVGQ